jgi:hypothetical protein
MRMPRGHGYFNLSDIVFLVFQLLAIPVLSVVALVGLAIGKIWCSYSWLWLLVPVGATVIWWITMQLRVRQ